MNYFSKYAEQKFDILNKYKVFITKEEVEECLDAPDKETRKNSHICAQKDGLKVIYSRHGNIKKILTFFPC